MKFQQNSHSIKIFINSGTILSLVFVNLTAVFSHFGGHFCNMSLSAFQKPNASSGASNVSIVIELVSSILEHCRLQRRKRLKIFWNISSSHFRKHSSSILSSSCCYSCLHSNTEKTKS